jgi:hypothetical protein
MHAIWMIESERLEPHRLGGVHCLAPLEHEPTHGVPGTAVEVEEELPDLTHVVMLGDDDDADYPS